MQMRFLGKSGLRVSVVGFGTMSFGGRGEFFAGVGAVEQNEATRMVGLCLDRGVNLFDTADVYSGGLAEEFLGRALAGKREAAIVATKAHGRMGDGPNDAGASRHHLIRACEASLRRLGTDYIDLYQLHGFDANTPLEETLSALSTLVESGKVRYIGCSNFSAWHLMKALATSRGDQFESFSSQQIFYSLVAREAEFELIPVALDQGVGTLVYSPLAGGFLAGTYRRGQSWPHNGRGEAIGLDGVLDVETGYGVVDALDVIAKERGRTVAQVSLNWLRRKPYVASLLLGARTIDQLDAALRCLDWDLSADEEAHLDKVSVPPAPYPYWHQRKYNSERGSIDGRV